VTIKYIKISAGILFSEKVQNLTEVMQRRYIMIMCLHAVKNLLYRDFDIATNLEISHQDMLKTKQELMTKCLIDESWNIVGIAGADDKKNRGNGVIKGSMGTRLPQDWTLPSEWLIWAEDEFPAWPQSYIQKEALKFHDYWIAKTGKDATKMNWLATWRNWCRNAKKPDFLSENILVKQSYAEQDRNRKIEKWEKIAGKKHPERAGPIY
jgi:hypothetical protein